MSPYLAVLASLFLAACSVFGDRSGTPEPPYDVIAKLGNNAEVRRYGERVAAETDMSNGLNGAFRCLAAYIGGANEGASEIAMTAPVATTKPEKIAMTAPVEIGPTMRFFLPKTYTPATAPKPTDARIHLVDVPPRTEAVLRYTGPRGPARVDAKAADLKRLLQNSPYRPVGRPVGYFYDPPWTLPWLKRNEVAVPVEE